MSTRTRCRSKVFPCPAGDRCPEHKGMHAAIDYSIEQQDFNRFLELRNRVLPALAVPSGDINVASTRWDKPWEKNAYNKEYDALIESVDKATDSAIYYYTEGGMYRRLNIWLREDRNLDNWPSLEREVVDSLDALAATYRRPNPEAPLWRGVTGDYAKKISKLRVGQTIQEHAFTSTSIDPFTVRMFTDERAPVIMQILTAKGVPVSRRTEAEYLLPRGMKLRVESKRRVNLNISNNRFAQDHKFENTLLITVREVEDQPTG